MVCFLFQSAPIFDMKSSFFWAWGTLLRVNGRTPKKIYTDRQNWNQRQIQWKFISLYCNAYKLASVHYFFTNLMSIDKEMFALFRKVKYNSPWYSELDLLKNYWRSSFFRQKYDLASYSMHNQACLTLSLIQFIWHVYLIQYSMYNRACLIIGTIPSIWHLSSLSI
jgi:hypothetical protein